MPLFGKNPPPETQTDNIPVDQVSSMKAQGLDNNQIIQTLQRSGYTSEQIFEAINRIELPPTTHEEDDYPQSDISHYSDQPEIQNQNYDFPPQQPNFAPQEALVQFNSQSAIQTEELVESIIEEKWNELVKDIKKVIDWKNKTETKISNMEQQFQDLKDNFDKLHKAIIGKIGDYDKNILNVGAEVKAMEKVFSKVLPVFIDNVNDLSRITEVMKNKK
ncbi:MAG: hypothetical protein ABIC91_06390 [Nanoarchaeota archaeon]|nr:hypothetical protein [Nanoarchaeota archaeon]MBU1030403.1 hypothetical protein [Nanoarchaeota archaeon]MBU1850025.1 hypothetical protein [Nanoarchaeota archaeon]